MLDTLETELYPEPIDHIETSLPVEPQEQIAELPEQFEPTVPMEGAELLQPEPEVLAPELPSVGMEVPDLIGPDIHDPLDISRLNPAGELGLEAEECDECY